MQAPF